MNEAKMYWCLRCKEVTEYSALHIDLGPLQDELIVAREEITDGTFADKLSVFRCEKLYRGKRLVIRCPFCELEVHVAADLAGFSIGRYLRDHQSCRDLQMERIFESPEGRCQLRPFPLHCPRCDGQIERENMPRACRACGCEQMQHGLPRTDISAQRS